MITHDKWVFVGIPKSVEVFSILLGVQVNFMLYIEALLGVELLFFVVPMASRHGTYRQG